MSFNSNPKKRQIAKDDFNPKKYQERFPNAHNRSFNSNKSSHQNDISISNNKASNRSKHSILRNSSSNAIKNKISNANKQKQPNKRKKSKNNNKNNDYDSDIASTSESSTDSFGFYKVNEKEIEKELFGHESDQFEDEFQNNDEFDEEKYEEPNLDDSDDQLEAGNINETDEDIEKDDIEVEPVCTYIAHLSNKQLSPVTWIEDNGRIYELRSNPIKLKEYFGNICKAADFGSLDHYNFGYGNYSVFKSGLKKGQKQLNKSNFNRIFDFKIDSKFDWSSTNICFILQEKSKQQLKQLSNINNNDSNSINNSNNSKEEAKLARKLSKYNVIQEKIATGVIKPGEGTQFETNNKRNDLKNQSKKMCDEEWSKWLANEAPIEMKQFFENNKLSDFNRLQIYQKRVKHDLFELALFLFQKVFLMFLCLDYSFTKTFLKCVCVATFSVSQIQNKMIWFEVAKFVQKSIMSQRKLGATYRRGLKSNSNENNANSNKNTNANDSSTRLNELMQQMARNSNEAGQKTDAN